MWEEITNSPIKENTKTNITNDNDIYRVERQNADIDLNQGQQGGRKNSILNQGYPTSKERNYSLGKGRSFSFTLSSKDILGRAEG